MNLESPKNFFGFDADAITVDFVLVTAIVVGFGLAAMYIVTPGVQSVASGFETVIQTSESSAHSLYGFSD